MNQSSKRFTLTLLGIAVILIGGTLFLKRQYFVELYWISQLSEKDRELEAARKLSDMKCYRSIPDILDEFRLMLKEDSQNEMFISQNGITATRLGFNFMDSEPLAFTQVHPMLYSIYSMRAEGTEKLLNYRNENWDQPKVKGSPVKRTENFPGGSIKAKEFRLLRAIDIILGAWENADLQLLEGPEMTKHPVLIR